MQQNSPRGDPSKEGGPFGAALWRAWLPKLVAARIIRRMERTDARRRIPFAIVGLGLGVAAMIVGYGLLRQRDASPGPGWIQVGTTQHVNQARVTFVPGIPAYVVVTPGGPIGLYARSPQLGEPVEYCTTSGYFEDPMHGSKFDPLGDYALGPAPRGLDRLQVRTVGDQVWIYPLDHLLGSTRGSPPPSRPTGPFCTARS